MFIDLHSHLDYEPLAKRLPEVIENAKSTEVGIMVTSGICPESNQKVIDLTKKYNNVKATIGLYPPDALHTEKNGPDGTFKFDIDLDKEVAFIRKHKDQIVGIGEIGLDYQNGSDKDMQKKVFRTFLDLAVELNKPVIIHSRKAELDAIEILEEYTNKNSKNTNNNQINNQKSKLKVIMHCFSGKKNLMLRARDNGYFFTIPTHVVRSGQFQEMIKLVQINQLFCETDSPFLSPFKEKLNEPAFVIESYKMIAKIKGLDLKEVENLIYNNWQKVFL